MREFQFSSLKQYLCLIFACLSAGCLDATPAFADDAIGSTGQNPASASSRPLITFTTKSGEVISNAEIIRTNDGVSLVWEKDRGASGGTVRLEDLPPDLRDRFGYSYEKTKTADELAEAKRAQWQKEVADAALAEQKAQQAAAQSAKTNQPSASTNQATTTVNQPVKKRTPVQRHYSMPTRSGY